MNRFYCLCYFLGLALASSAQSQPAASGLVLPANKGVVSTLAGQPDTETSLDGPGYLARFACPSGVTVDAQETVYVADKYNHTIRRISAAGLVSTLAGQAGKQGGNDGIGPAAHFNHPTALAVDAAGNVYVADQYNHTIRKISPTGAVTTLAGFAGSAGSADGVGKAARFNQPTGVAVDGAGVVYVADRFNHTIRKISPVGEVTTLAGLAGNAGTVDGTGPNARFDIPLGVGVDAEGTVYVAALNSDGLRQISPDGVVTTISRGLFHRPIAIAVKKPGRAFVLLANESTILITPKAGPEIILAGFGRSCGYAGGSSDGDIETACFATPTSLAVGSDGTIYVADEENQNIRRVTPDGQVSTLAGRGASPASDIETGVAARFRSPTALAMSTTGTLYVADKGDHLIRQISPAGIVTPTAGKTNVPGSANGPGSEARFGSPVGVAVAADNTVYLTEYGYAPRFRRAIRKISANGLVSSIPTTSVPTAVATATNANETIYFVDDNGVPYKWPLKSEPKVLAGKRDAGFGRTLRDGTRLFTRFYLVAGMAVDTSGTVYVADQGDHTIRKISPAGAVSILAGKSGTAGHADGTGAAARFYNPAGVAVDASGTVYVADEGNHTIRRISAAGVVSTLAGTYLSPGYVNGTGAAARFNHPTGIAVDAAGAVYVADRDNQAIRVIR